tara:strand:+ start:365 stop:814 length:450 start_codon:yes stop_codon:yes gene_type:complete
MKTYINITAALVFLFSIHSNAQVFQDQLDEIYLGSAKIELNDFILLNSEISNSDRFKFSKALRAARNGQDSLVFTSDKYRLALTEVEYLKLIRRTANQSSDSTEFVTKLSAQMPSLKDIIESDASYTNLYEAVRPATFYGRIEALPDVL